MECEIRAVYDTNNVRVYQAYSPEIADAAISASTFVPPFSMNRMTWIKPSFLWMMYRSYWASRPSQERILAIDIKRTGFEWALGHSCLTSYDPTAHSSRDEWRRQLTSSPVRIQWDPDRDIYLNALSRRAIQVGLTSEAVQRYTNDWIVRVSDCTHLAREIRHVSQSEPIRPERYLPDERPYPLTGELRAKIGATH